MENKRHNYEYAVDTESQTAPANVVRLVGLEKRVLEIGCGPGSITKILMEKSGCKVVGLELDPSAIEKVKPYCEKVLQADLNSSEWPHLLDEMGGFDVVVAADVLEHLYDPWASLQRMVPLMKDNGCIVISLPHAGHAAVLSCLQHGNFEYRDWGLLDRTHIRFFGLRNIEALFAQAGLKIIDVRFVTKPPSETEFAETWAALTPSVQDALMSSKHANVYQVVVKAVPLKRVESAVALIPPPFQYTSVYVKSDVAHSKIAFKTWLGQYFSENTKSSIRRGLNMLGIKL